MKTIAILFVSAMTLGSGLQAQDLPADKVPSVVLNSFQTKFANAKDLQWEAKGDLYKAEFEIGSREHDVWLDKTGAVKKHKQDFPKSELPAVIRKKIETDFAGYKIDDADKIEEDGAVFYEVDLDGTAGDRKLLFTADGQVKDNKSED